MDVLKPPAIDYDLPRPFVFFGGSIEMGKAIDWQTDLTKSLSSHTGTILNPRREDWDSSWKQDPIPGTPFYGQVTWELDHQDDSDIIVYYFDENTKSPITLLELGLYANTHKIIVFCTPKFYRYGNVKIVCDKYNIPVYSTHKEFFNSLVAAIDGFEEEKPYRKISDV